MKPQFITFTGIDVETDLDRVQELSSRYPVEWGILFSPKRQGNDNRYPEAALIPTIVETLNRQEGMRLAAHICGGHSVEIMAYNDPGIHLVGFGRAQINSATPDIEAIEMFVDRHQVQGIAQSRALTFPESSRIAWLYDCSGGRGDSPSEWPQHPGAQLVGYAGGLNPINVREQLALMDTSGPFWIDMESGVRTDDWLDLDKCEAVCRAVFDAD